MSKTRGFDPEKIIRVLANYEVEYVLIGAMAARLQGFPRITADADITPKKTAKNVHQLALALQELDANIYTESVPAGVPFACSADNLMQGNLWNLVTNAGRLDIIFKPAGVKKYDHLQKNALLFEAFDTRLQVASLEDIIVMKKASDRPQDRQDIIILREILNRHQKK